MRKPKAKHRMGCGHRREAPADAVEWAIDCTSLSKKSKNLTSASTRRFLTMALLAFVNSMIPLVAEEDAREIVRRTVSADKRNWQAARNYGFVERVDARRMDSEGRLKSQDVTSYDVLLLAGTPYRRLAARNDHPIPPHDERKEQARLAKSIAERGKETASQRATRVAEYVNRPDWLREIWHELPDAFDFRLTGRETFDGKSLYVIEAAPRKEYHPRTRTAKVLAQLAGKLWVDPHDYRLVKAEVKVVETISVGLFLVRLAKGSRAAFEQTMVSNEVWLPRRVQVFASARVGLIKMLHIEQEIIYSKSREFQEDSLLETPLWSR